MSCFRSFRKAPNSGTTQHDLVTCPTETYLRDPAQAIMMLTELIAAEDLFDLQETMVCAFGTSGRMQDALTLIESLTSHPGDAGTDLCTISIGNFAKVL